mmetsp:Transcript_12730/g.25828  ORF Transcript_12730/g.25828 Transcript_12730/m.25828 type:complete len:93 (-) Transcript_12730:1261-1539(-)
MSPMTTFVVVRGSWRMSDGQAPCAACGRQGGPLKNCDGNGRMLGGLAVVVPWWPIKAFRPCPELVAVQGTYVRAGQSLVSGGLGILHSIVMD